MKPAGLTAVGGTLCAVLALEFSGGFEVLAAYSPVSPFVAVMGLALVVITIALTRTPVLPVWSPLLAMIGYLLAVTVSFVLSTLPETVTATGVQEALKLVLFTAVVTVLVAYRTNWALIAMAVTVPMAIISVLAMANEFLLGNSRDFLGFETVSDYLGVGSTTARHAGPMEDPNFWGRLLAAGIPLSLALVQRAIRSGHRWAALCGATSTAALFAGVYLTSSRGAFLAAAAGTACYLIAVGVSALRLALIAGLGGLVLVIPGVGSRLFSFGSAGTQAAAEDQSVVARLVTQRVALAMVEDRPLFGVGPDGYLSAFGRYAAEAGQPIDRVLAPHNLYLGLWAETGLLGLAGFLAVLAVGITLAARTCLAARRMPHPVRDRYRPYAAALLAGLLAWCTASVFLHLSYARVPLLLVCLAAALWQQARQLPVAGVRTTVPRVVPVAAGAVAGAALAVGGMLLAPHGSTVAMAGRVVPADAENSYLISLRTRTGVIPSLAVVIDKTAPRPVEAQGDVSAGLVTVSASAATADEARDRVQAAVASGGAALDELQMSDVFRVVWDSEPTTTPAAATRTELAAAAAGGATAGVIGGLVGSRAVAGWRRRHPQHRGTQLRGKS